MPLIQVEPERYSDQLASKVAELSARFLPLGAPEPEVFSSPSSHYRMRTEFRIWHNGDQLDYVMFAPENPKEPIALQEFPVASHLINRLMGELKIAIEANEVLKRKLFQIEFLTTLTGEALVTLIYHKPLDEQWQQAAEPLQSELGISIIGRSRKQKRVLERDYVLETLNIAGRDYRYQQVEGSFTQPNAKVCEKMVTWAVEQSRGIGGDLIELYCGNGNFTLPLSRQFERVLATEISKTSVKSAHYNLEMNGIENVQIVRMSSEEFSSALMGAREFRRLAHVDLPSYQFSTIFVDPPRAGLDEQSIELVSRFDHILYISCNPATLYENLQSLAGSHTIERFAIFDQFPYTHHTECGVLLKRRAV